MTPLSDPIPPDVLTALPPYARTIVSVTRRRRLDIPDAEFRVEHYPCSASPSIARYLARTLQEGTLTICCGEAAICIPAEQVVDFVVRPRPPQQKRGAAEVVDSDASPDASSCPGT